MVVLWVVPGLSRSRPVKQNFLVCSGKKKKLPVVGVGGSCSENPGPTTMGGHGRWLLRGTGTWFFRDVGESRRGRWWLLSSTLSDAQRYSLAEAPQPWQTSSYLDHHHPRHPSTTITSTQHSKQHVRKRCVLKTAVRWLTWD